MPSCHQRKEGPTLRSPSSSPFLAAPINQDGRHSQAKSSLLAGNKVHFLAFFFFLNLTRSLEGFPLLMAYFQEQINVCAKGQTFLVASEFLGASGLLAA